MAQFDDYIAAVTRRLRPDAELHMEIAHEVRTHLEDAAAAAHKRGLDDDASQTEALRAFGNADEVATALFAANRRRMRLRAVLKWAARATLLPAVLLVTVFVVGAATVNFMGVLSAYGFVPRNFAGIDWWKAEGLRRDLSDDERFVAARLHHDPQSAAELAARFPTNPRYHVYYTRVLLDRHRRSYGDKADPDWTTRVLAALDRGNELEPDNAYYDVMRAGVLMQSAWHETSKDGRFVRVEITDRNALKAAAAALRRAAQKDHLRTYSLDAEKEWRDMCPSPDTLLAQVGFFAQMSGGMAPELDLLRTIGRALPTYALVLADDGETDEALELLSALERTGVMFSVQTNGVDPATPRAHSCIISALKARAQVLEKAGQTAAASTAHKRAEEERRRMKVARTAMSSYDASDEKRCGIFMHLCSSPNATNPEGVAQMRKAENCIALRAALSAVLLVPLLGTLLLSGLATLNLLSRRRRANRALLFFVGWRRLARVILWAFVVPVAAYTVWLCVLPNPLMEYGLHAGLTRMLIEIALLFVISAGTLFHMGCRVVRERLAEAGADLPADRYFRPFHGRWGVVRAVVLVLPALLYFATWTPPDRSDTTRFMVELGCAGSLIAAWGLYTLWQLLRLRTATSTPRFSVTFVRSFLPILIVWLIACGTLTHVVLPWAERRAIAPINQPGYQPLLGEFPDVTPGNRVLREHHRELDRQWRERQQNPNP